jgi:hypothetical protein
MTVKAPGKLGLGEQGAFPGLSDQLSTAHVGQYSSYALHLIANQL